MQVGNSTRGSFKSYPLVSAQGELLGVRALLNGNSVLASQDISKGTRQFPNHIGDVFYFTNSTGGPAERTIIDEIDALEADQIPEQGEFLEIFV